MRYSQNDGMGETLKQGEVGEVLGHMIGIYPFCAYNAQLLCIFCMETTKRYKDPGVVGALEAFVTLKTLLELWKLALVQIQQSPVLWGLCLGGIEHSCGVDGSSSSGPKQVVVGQLTQACFLVARHID